jgi:hypothetical protein
VVFFYFLKCLDNVYFHFLKCLDNVYFHKDSLYDYVEELEVFETSTRLYSIICLLLTSLLLFNAAILYILIFV